MLLLSLVLIYLSGLALSTLISCLLSFLLPVYVTPTSQVIFLPLMLMNGYERHSAGTAAASAALELQCASAPRLPGSAGRSGRLPRNSFSRLGPPRPLSPKEIE